MMSLGHLIVILVIFLLLFGANKIPNVMKDIAKGLKIFRDEITDNTKDIIQDTKDNSKKSC